MDAGCIFATNCGKNISSESLNIYVNAFLFLHQSTQYIHIIFTLWLKEKKLRTRGEKEMYTRKNADIYNSLDIIRWIVSVLFPFFWSLVCTVSNLNCIGSRAYIHSTIHSTYHLTQPPCSGTQWQCQHHSRSIYAVRFWQFWSWLFHLKLHKVIHSVFLSLD